MDEKDAINPPHYRGFSDGAEVISISENLTSNGGQAVQYIARSTRLDQSLIKGDPIEDLTKALWFIEREIGRLKAAKLKFKFQVLGDRIELVTQKQFNIHCTPYDYNPMAQERLDEVFGVVPVSPKVTCGS